MKLKEWFDWTPGFKVAMVLLLGCLAERTTHAIAIDLMPRVWQPRVHPQR